MKTSLAKATANNDDFLLNWNESRFCVKKALYDFNFISSSTPQMTKFYLFLMSLPLKVIMYFSSDENLKSIGDS